MSMQWSLGILLVASILGWSGAEYCYDPYSCVAEPDCLSRGAAISYRTARIIECGAGEVCCQTVKSLLCGTSNPRGVGNELKQSRDDSRPGEFPWTVAVFYNENVIGAGSIVAPGVVLTAAHILKNMTAADIKIRAGDWDLTSDQESFKPQERLVTLVRKHKEFVYETGANDLAIVFLDRPFQLNNHIRPICLPSQERSYLKNTCIVTGWGVKNYRDPYLSHVLKAIELPLVDRVRCQDQLRQTKLGPDFELDPSVICAGGEEGVDSCTGDGGSAIICQVRGDRNRYVQVGIVNWGVECGKKDVPAVYTNLEIFNDWIDQQLKNIASPVGQIGQ